MDSFKLSEGQFSKLLHMPHISLELKRELLASSEFIAMAKNSLLFSQGEDAQNFYLILSGAVKLLKESSITSESKQTVLDILGPGEMIGAALMLDASVQNIYPISAKTLGTTEVLRFSKKSFHEIWVGNSDLLAMAYKSILKRIDCMQKDRCIQKFTLEQKVAYFMTEKWLSSSNMRITRKDIADCIGASQEAVIRLLNDWTRRELVKNKNHEIEVHNIKEIRSLWESE